VALAYALDLPYKEYHTNDLPGALARQCQNRVAKANVIKTSVGRGHHFDMSSKVAICAQAICYISKRISLCAVTTKQPEHKALWALVRQNAEW
jgi:hypothetical protein